MSAYVSTDDCSTKFSKIPAHGMNCFNSIVLVYCDMNILDMWCLALVRLHSIIVKRADFCAWWRHQMETFSALLALYAGISPVTGELPSQSQWRGALMFSFICAWTNGWPKKSRCRLFETPSRPLWRHCNGWCALFWCLMSLLLLLWCLYRWAFNSFWTTNLTFLKMDRYFQYFCHVYLVDFHTSVKQIPSW